MYNYKEFNTITTDKEKTEKLKKTASKVFLFVSGIFLLIGVKKYVKR